MSFRLKKLTLSNFQGISYQEIDLDGESASIYGENATGKTTIFNGFTWLLFGTPSTGAKNYTPQTVGTHNMEYSAEALIEIDGGAQMLLRKVYKEVYKKKRGNPHPEFSGYTTEYFVDGIPKQEGEYQKVIAQLVGDPDKLKMLTMPSYFAEGTKWQDRRKILLDICGDVGDWEVCASNEDLRSANFYDMLLKPGSTDERYRVEDFKKISSTERTKINKELETTPALIMEAQRAIPETSSKDLETLKAEHEQLISEDEELERRIASMSTSSAETEIRSQIEQENLSLAKAEAEHIRLETEKNAEKNAVIADLQKALNIEQTEAFKIRSEVASKELELRTLVTERETLLADWKTVNSQIWDESEGVCPTCGRPYETDKIDQLREEFNLRRSQRLEKINTEAQTCSKTVIAAKQAEIDSLKERLSVLEKSAAQTKTMIEAKQAEIIKPIAFNRTEEFTNAQKRLTELTLQLSDASTAMRKMVDGLKTELSFKRDAVRNVAEKIANKQTEARQLERIEELKASQKDLAKAYEAADYKVHLCEVFTKAKVDLLDEKINSRFMSLRFKLFEEQLNGGVKDCCEVLIPSEGGTLVPWPVANNAAKINAGMEIIDTLRSAWDMHVPVFVENAEAVTHLTTYPDLQVIRLVVSEPDKSLRLERGAGAA
jgi:DNA repair exonuclease SbcCD ATPase subunit